MSYFGIGDLYLELDKNLKKKKVNNEISIFYNSILTNYDKILFHNFYNDAKKVIH